MKIRDASAADATTISEFNSAMAIETGDPPLDPVIVAAGVSDILQDETKGRYWVAEIEGEIVGQICVTYEWSDWRNATQWWIQSVYILPAHRRKGVFSSLYHHVKSTAHAGDNVCGLRLYVRADNKRAKNTYESLFMTVYCYVVMGEVF